MNIRGRGKSTEIIIQGGGWIQRRNGLARILGKIETTKNQYLYKETLWEGAKKGHPWGKEGNVRERKD